MADLPQFFITFRSCNHLDRKHTVFGKLVGGMNVLDAMEKVATDAKDRPTEVCLGHRRIAGPTAQLCIYSFLKKNEEE